MRSKLAYTITRIVLGLAFLFFGAVKFFPMETPELPQPAMNFMLAMGATGYMIPMIGIAEILVGLLLLINIWVPFSMMVLSPIMLNIALFNIFLGPSIPGALFVGVPILLQVYIMYYTWNAYKPLFSKIR